MIQTILSHKPLCSDMLAKQQNKMSAPMRKFLVQQINHTSSKRTGAVIIFHGSGDTARGLRGWLKDEIGVEFSFPHLNVILPTGPARPYSLSGGMLSNVWFDRTELDQDVPETDSVTSMCHQLEPLVKEIVDSGIPKNKIIIGGYSMGACMAMHMVYRFHPEVAGCFALSGFLNNGSSVYDAIHKSSGNTPPLFYCHGEADPLVSFKWGEKTSQQLRNLGVKVDFHSFPHLEHELDRKELLMLKDWIGKVLPEEK